MIGSQEAGMKKWMMTLIGVALAAAFVPGGSVAQNPPNTAAPADAKVSELETRGDSLRNQKDYEQAARTYRAALRQDKKNATLYNKLGLAELQMGNYRSAQSSFEKAVKYDPKLAYAVNNAGVAAYAQKRYDAAAKSFKKALALNEANAVFHSNLGVTWFAKEMYDRASAEFARALDLDPVVFERMQRGGIAAQITPASRARHAYILAKLYAKRGDVDNALQSLRKAKEEGYPKMSDVYKEPEFSGLVQDARLMAIVPPKR